jgi:hypothetical protein
LPSIPFLPFTVLLFAFAVNSSFSAFFLSLFWMQSTGKRTYALLPQLLQSFLSLFCFSLFFSVDFPIGSIRVGRAVFSVPRHFLTLALDELSPGQSFGIYLKGTLQMPICVGSLPTHCVSEGQSDRPDERPDLRFCAFDICRHTRLSGFAIYEP